MGLLVLFITFKGDSKAVSDLRVKYFVETETLEQLLGCHQHRRFSCPTGASLKLQIKIVGTVNCRGNTELVLILLISCLNR